MIVLLTVLASAVAAEPKAVQAPNSDELLRQLKTYRHRVIYETYRDGNWELFLMNADGSNPVNLTRTPDCDELYPKASPDGTKLCFEADEGKDAAKVRNIYLMNIDGTGRTRIVENGRDPCWTPDGKSIAYMKGLPGPYTTDHSANKGLFFFDLATGKHTPHVNQQIERVLCLGMSPDGQWFTATAAGGLGYSFAIIAFQAHGTKHFELLGSDSPTHRWQCRPDLSPDGKKLAYAKARGQPPDKVFAIEAADIDLTAPAPKLSDLRHVVEVPDPLEVYHADWSPDGRYILFSRGAKEPSKMKPQRAIVAIQAPGWDICVADANALNVWAPLTTDGLSNKEPDWVFVK
jgi:Tol biopolymer transport system component